jgi:hypothetical protein
MKDEARTEREEDLAAVEEERFRAARDRASGYEGRPYGQSQGGVAWGWKVLLDADRVSNANVI